MSKTTSEEVAAVEAGLLDLGSFKREKRPEHSHLGASSAVRWFPCPGSVNLSKGIEEGPPETWRTEGNVAHAVSSDLLERGMDAWEALGHKIDLPHKKVKDFVIDQDMVDGVQIYLDTIRDDAVGPDIGYIERMFDLPHIDKDLYGTVDYGAVFPDEHLLRVYDLKYGEGIVVEVEHNEQAMYYGVGLLDHIASENPELGIAEIELVIVQPRAYHHDGPVRRWRISVDDLAKWALTTLLGHVKDTRDPDAPLRPGDWCRFCRAKAVCPALRGVFDVMAEEKKRPQEMEDWEVAERLARVAAVRKFIGVLEDEAFQRLVKGRNVPGWKIVKKKSNRVWKDTAEEALIRVFGEEGFEKKLKSPAKIEKLGRDGKTFVTAQAFKPDAGLTLAPDSDKRENVPARDARAVFGGLVE